LQEIFPALPTAAANAILPPIDGLLGISAPGYAANEAATRNLSSSLIEEIREIDPRYEPPALAEPGGFPNTIEGRNNYIDVLRQDRAAAIYQTHGEVGPLQVESLRLAQHVVDQAYVEALELSASGQLTGRLSIEQAIGTHVDQVGRQELTRMYHRLGISTERGEPVRVNRRAPNSSDATYRVPDFRVGRVAMDMSIALKRPSDAQIRGFFNSDFGPTAVIIIRPNRLGGSYLITAPGPGGN
jgi:hypothetical protein